MNTYSELWEEDEKYIRQYGIDHDIILSDDMVDEFCEWVFDFAHIMDDQKARELALEQLQKRYEM